MALGDLDYCRNLLRFFRWVGMLACAAAAASGGRPLLGDLKMHRSNQHEREPLPYYLGHDSLLVVTEHRPGIEGLVARAP